MSFGETPPKKKPDFSKFQWSSEHLAETAEIGYLRTYSNKWAYSYIHMKPQLGLFMKKSNYNALSICLDKIFFVQTNAKKYIFACEMDRIWVFSHRIIFSWPKSPFLPQFLRVYSSWTWIKPGSILFASLYQASINPFWLGN